ncbi:MAG: hypothetical protein HY235_11675 [Acidobacteria bacterium]|nr:hypothetical protein [Acidobacteriota bacterium]
MLTLTENDVGEALGKIEPGLLKYCWIQANLHSRDVSTDDDFQRRFNDFYKVRRDAPWRGEYYRIMQAKKGQGIAFAEALQALRDRTGRLEASFASKLVATIDPTKPIIDKFVLRNFSLRLPYHQASNRELKVTGVYNQLCSNYEVLMGSSIGRLIREEFLHRYRWADISDLKKIDLVLWQIRDRQPNQGMHPAAQKPAGDARVVREMK